MNDLLMMLYEDLHDTSLSVSLVSGTVLHGSIAPVSHNDTLIGWMLTTPEGAEVLFSEDNVDFIRL